MNYFAFPPFPVRRLLTTMILLAAFLAGPPVYADGVVPGHVLTRLGPGVDGAQVARDYGTTVEDRVPDTPIYSFRTPNGTEENLAGRLSGDPRVVWAETDTYVDSPEHGQTFHFAFDVAAKVRAQGLPTDYVNQGVFAQVNWGRTTALATGAGVIVAVLDTGATFDHPALTGAYLPGYNAISPGQLPTDMPDGATNAVYGHGTMIAGIIARLAPAAKILPVRVLNADGDGTMLNVTKGIYFALAHGARVLNMSFGSRSRTGILNDALDAAEAAGVVIAASAGNDGGDIVQYPASGKGALAVGAVESNNVKSPYSNFGSWVRVVAPGTGIRSAYANGGYASWSGTSFAAPFVAAEAALILSVRPDLTSGGVTETIRGTCRSVDSVNPRYKGKLGKGLIDIETAVFQSLPAAPISLTLNPAAVFGGLPAAATVTLSRPAPSGGLNVGVTSSLPTLAAVPSGVLIPAGQTTARFSIATSPVAGFAYVTLRAAAGGVTKAVSLTLAPPTLQSLVLAPPTVQGGSTVSAAVTLTSPAPSGGLTVFVFSNTAQALVPSAVTVPTGVIRQTFSIVTRPVSAASPTTITVSRPAVQRYAVLTLTP